MSVGRVPGSGARGSREPQHRVANDIAFQKALSWSHPRSRWHVRATGKPVAVGLELDADLVVEDPEIAVAAARDGVRHHGLHLLRDHADIGLVAAEIAEAIITQAVVEMAEQDDVVLQCDVRAPAPS